MTTRDTPEATLAAAGFDPPENVCAACKHSGGDHDGGNWCLLCPRPDVPARPIDGRLAVGWCYFTSMTKAQKWAYGIAALPPGWCGHEADLRAAYEMEASEGQGAEIARLTHELDAARTLAATEYGAASAEAVAARNAEIAEAVRGLPWFDWKLGDLPLVALAAVLAIVEKP
jgi:hypothetical protein